MAKAGMKRKKVEKAKTQLKKSKTAPGRFLPSGTNVTKTEFKVGKIVIPKQLQGTTDTGPVTKRKLGLKDLLAKLSHYSQSVRFESLEGLKELVTGELGGNLVEGNLSLLVTRLVPLTSDRERRVRKAAFSLLQAILSQVSETKLEPLFPLLTAHLSCCLTHLDTAIQQDGLNLIDSLVGSVPSFLALHYAKILPDCLEQISARKDGDAKVSVSADVSEKISSLQWRTDVLKRVDKILNAILAHRRSKVELVKRQSCVNIEFRENLYCNLYPGRPSYLGLSDLVNKAGEDPMLEIIDKIVPLILDSWVEAISSDSKKGRVGFLSNDVFPLLESVAGILEKLITYSQEVGPAAGTDNPLLDRLRSKYFTDLNTRLLSHIPYSNSSGKCNAQNILLSSVTLSLADTLEPELLSRIVSTLRSQTTDSEERLKVFKNLLFMSSIDQSSRDGALTLLMEMSTNLPAGSKQRLSCIRVLSDLAEREELLGSWLETLPNRVVSTSESSLPEKFLILETMLKFAKRRNQHLEKSLKLTSAALKDWCEGLENEEEREPSRTLLSYIQHHYV